MAVEHVCVVEGLCKTYGATGVVANRDLNLRVSPGEVLGLAGRSGSLMLRLSGGERQMVFLLSTFMGHRPLVILDEPTSNLDPVRRRLVWDFLRERAHEGIAIVLVTHNVAEADQAVHRAVVVDRGTVVADGTPGDLKRMVSRKIEIRVSLKPGAEWLLAGTARGEPLGGGRWIIRADPEESSQVLSHIIETQGLDGIDDFAVSGVSMDAVYEALTGEWWDERHERAIN